MRATDGYPAGSNDYVPRRGTGSAASSLRAVAQKNRQPTVRTSVFHPNYRARAGEYDATYPLDERADPDARRQLVSALEALAPYGRVLELACGTGQWTAELARHASAVTAVDASPEALAICRRRADMPHVSLVQADLFAWHPQERYDLVSSPPGSRTCRPSASTPSGR